MPVWYLNDGLFIGDLAFLDKVLSTLTVVSPTLGPFSKLHKVCEVDLTSSGSGINVLGVPIGDADFTEEELKSIHSKARGTTRRSAVCTILSPGFCCFANATVSAQ